MAWTPPSDAVVSSGGWIPPEDATPEDEDPSVLKQAGKDAFGGIESAGRMLWNAPAGFVAKGLGSVAGLAMGEDLPQALELGDEAANRISIPPLTKSGEVADEMLGAGYEGARAIAGDIGASDLTKLDPKEEAKGRSLYEAGFDLLAFGGLLKGGVSALKAKPKSPYDGLRKVSPELEGKTDAQIVDWLETKAKEKAVLIEKRTQGELFDVTPPEGQYGTTDPLTSAREAALGELRSLDESAAFGRKELNPNRELFPESTGLEKPVTNLEPKRETTSEIIQPEGITDPKKVEAGFEATRIPSREGAPLDIENPAHRPDVIPYTNTINDYIYSRFPELTERLQRDKVVQRLMVEVDKLVDHMSATKSQAGIEYSKGVKVVRPDFELMPGAKTPGERTLAVSNRNQAEMNRLKAEYERSAERLDTTIQQLSNRLKSRSKGIGSDIANNAKFSDWVNERLNSSGPMEGQIPRSMASNKSAYKEGSASANIEKVQGLTGFGKSQRGSIGFKPEDPFKKFEDSLPIPFKHLAKDLWKDVQDKKSIPEPIANPKDVAAGKVLKGVTGVDLYKPMLQPFKEAKEWLMSGTDIAKGFRSAIGNNLEPGANLRAMSTRNPVIKYVSDNIRYSKEATRAAIQNKMHGSNGILTTWQKLTSAEQVELARVIEKYKGKQDPTPELLRSEGLNEKQITARMSAYDHFTDTLNQINAERVAHDMKPIAPQPGYWPASWSGDYSFEVRKRQPDGRLELVRLETGNWKGIGEKTGLAGVRAKFLAEHGHEYEVGPIEQRARKGDTAAALKAFDQLKDMLDKTNPDREVLDRLFEQYNEALASKTRNFEEHFKIPQGVEGYKGNKLGASDAQNVKDMLYSAEGYFNDAHDYLETKKAARNVNGMLFDSDIRAQYPNALNYVRDYWNASRGVEFALAKVIDYLPEKLAESVGLSRYAITKTATQNLRNNMMLFFLGFNRPVFVLAQRIQSVQFTTPSLYKMKADLGMDGWDTAVGKAAALGYTDSMFAQSSPSHMSPLGKEALKWAKENHIIDQVFIDEIHTVASKKGSEIVKYLNGSKALTWADRSSRVDAYLQMVHLLKHSELKGVELYQAASDAMKRAMVDYTQEERPLIYKKMGMVGDLASPLTTFMHNYYTQLYMYGKEMLKNPVNPAYSKAALAFLATQYVMAGYMGMPGRQDLDWIIDTARAHGFLDPRTKNVTQALAAWSDGLQEKTRNALRYGGFASATGMDISPTIGASQLIPEQGIGGRFPVVAKAGEILGNAGNVAWQEVKRLNGGSGSTSTDRAQLLQSATPPAFKAVREAVTQNPRTGMIPNPKESMAGDVRRGPPSLADKNWLSSALGTTSIKESEERTAAFQSKMQEEAITKRKQVLITQIKELQTDHKDWSKEAKEYVSYGETFNNLLNAINQNQLDQQRTRFERAKGIPKNLNQAEKYKRASEYGVSK